MTTIREAVTQYIDRGWRPILVKTGEKTPIGKAWQNSQPGPEKFGADSNVGIYLGPDLGGLIDIDLDISEAQHLAKLPGLFGDLPAFGREGQAPGHRLVVGLDAPDKTIKFKLPSDHGLAIGKDMVLELRSRQQSVFPPSRYKLDDGSYQPIVWAAGEMPQEVPELQWEELHRRAGLLAFLSVVACAYPREPGNRDEVCMALAGTLARLNISAEVADEWIVAIAEWAGDEEAEQRAGKVEPAAVRLAAGEEIVGLPRLIELLNLDSCEKDIRKWTGAKKRRSKQTAPSNAIVIEDGQLNEIVDQAQAALLASSLPIYARNTMLVRVLKVGKEMADDGIRRDAGITMLMPVEPAWLVQAMAKASPWARPTKKEGEFRPTDPAEKYARALLARSGEWEFPELVAVVTTPTIDAQHRIIQKPGYDSQSGILLDFEEGAFPPIDEHPSKKSSEAALADIRHLLSGFPFVDEAAESVAISGILAAIIRASLPAAPLHAFDAPTPGTGKSLLAEIIGLIATGHRPPAMSQGSDDEETEKRLSVVLQAGDPVLLIDNCERALKGEFLCLMLTQETVKARILGQSKIVVIPSKTLVLATGNNMSIVADMTRRALVCRLDSGEDQPEHRVFKFNPADLVKQDRGKYVSAALTILSGYIAAGEPTQLKPLGSFEAYALVREALVWLDMPDPIETREALTQADPYRTELAEVMAAWVEVFGSEPQTLAEVHAACQGEEADEGKKKLLQLLQDRAGGFWKPGKIGWWLRKNKDRMIDGSCFRSEQAKDRQRWWVEHVDAKQEPDAVQSTPEGQDDFPF